MDIQSLRLVGLQLVRPRLFPDARGFFVESYQSARYLSLGLGPFVQDNFVLSYRNVLRGLHFQEHPGQAKLVSVLQGKIWDVAVDCRQDSPTFGEWEAVELDDQTLCQFFIPVGFAHGYCTLSDTAKVQYKVSTLYNPAYERSIRWNDPDLKIQWPLTTPLLSERDMNSPSFQEACRP